MNETATAIASAVEEQGGATQEISRNVIQAAQGTQEVSGNIVGVSQAAQQTGAASLQVLASAGELSQNGETLKTQVQALPQRSARGVVGHRQRGGRAKHGFGVHGMDSIEDGDGDGLIHPAFQARISQLAAARQIDIRQMTALASADLENTAVSLQRAAEVFPEAARITSAVRTALTAVSASLQRWNSGEVPISAEVDAAATCMKEVHSALFKVRELLAGGEAVSAVPSVCPNPSHDDVERAAHLSGWS